MTVPKAHERLEGPGLWRAGPDAQRRNVAVALGRATLIISDRAGTALAHWSLAAVIRLNPGAEPALYAPGKDSAESLEIADLSLVRALETLRAAIDRRRPRRGRLRQALAGGLLAGVTALGIFWLPGALIGYTAGVVPEPVRLELGRRIAGSLQRLAGRPCREPLALAALDRLGRSLLRPDRHRIEVLADLPRPALHLPGKVLVLDSALFEDQPTPFAAAGFLLAEDEYARRHDPMLAFLRAAGLRATLRLLTTGRMPETVIDRYSTALIARDHPPLEPALLLARFEAAGLPATPYARVLDPGGTAALARALIAADPIALARAEPPVSDDDWVSLQGICTPQ